MWTRLQTFFKHRWLDESDTRRAIAPDALERLRQRVAASELRHGGEIRMFVEASLPISYLWRHLRHKSPMAELARERALSIFGKLRVWDTENNNGVLIYLLLAERRIELVADRALDRVVDAPQWQAMVQRMGAAFSSGRFEDGLAQALEEVTEPLVRHFPLHPGSSDSNELPDTPELG
ncbi:MAG: TPM domain-containing protein [Burkholderiaceae bacterium]